MRRKRRQVLRPLVDRLDERCLLSAGLTPTQITTAYGLSKIAYTSGSSTATLTGAGETIAIIDAYNDPYVASDLATFDAKYGLAKLVTTTGSTGPTLVVDNLAGATTDDGWAGEETLDVEWAHAIAPGANIVVVEARSDSGSDLIAAVQAATAMPKVTVVSMSWGGGEFSGETRYDSVFTTPAGHVPITFVASSGDSGSMNGAEWPAVSPNVVSVGGTTLSINTSGSYSSESAWSGSGGGYSLYEAEPAYQDGVQSTHRRSTPDVAFDAEPNSGVSVYTTTPSTKRGAWEIVGGTSFGAPAWSAIIAMVDQGLGVAGKASLSSSATLTELYNLPTADFHTVSSTGNGSSQTTPITSTGLGSPVGSTLLTDLVTGKTRQSSGAGTGTVTGTGAGGGHMGHGYSAAWWGFGGLYVGSGAQSAGTGSGTTQARVTAGTTTTSHGSSGHASITRHYGTQAVKTSSQAVTTVVKATTHRNAVVVESPGTPEGWTAASKLATPVFSIDPSPLASLPYAPRVVTAIDEVLKELEERRWAIA